LMVVTKGIEPYPAESENVGDRIFDNFFSFFSNLYPNENANPGRVGDAIQSGGAKPRPATSCLSPRPQVRPVSIDYSNPSPAWQDDPNLAARSMPLRSLQSSSPSPTSPPHVKATERSRRHTVHPGDGLPWEGRDRARSSVTADTEDLLHQNVQYYLKKHPRVRERHTLARIRQGVYELDGREVDVEWHYATSPDTKGYLVVVDGPLRQPLSDYMEDTEANAQYDGKDFGWSHLQTIPQEKRISFNDNNTAYSRLEAMKVAKEQAIFRERAATYVKDGRDVPGELLTKYNKTIDMKLGRQQELRGSQHRHKPGEHQDKPGEPPKPLAPTTEPKARSQAVSPRTAPTPARNVPKPARSPAPAPAPSPGPPLHRELTGPPFCNVGPHATGVPTPTVPAEVPLTTVPARGSPAVAAAPPHHGAPSPPQPTPQQGYRGTLRAPSGQKPQPPTPQAHTREVPAPVQPGWAAQCRHRSPSPPALPTQVLRINSPAMSGSVSIPPGGGATPAWQGGLLAQGARSGSKTRTANTVIAQGASSPGVWSQCPASRGNSLQSNRAQPIAPTRLY
jgi:hypothetical protein